MKNLLILGVIVAMSCGSEGKGGVRDAVNSDVDMATSDMGKTLLPILERPSRIVKRCETKRVFSTLKTSKGWVENPYLIFANSKTMVAGGHIKTEFSQDFDLVYSTLSKDGLLSDERKVSQSQGWPFPTIQTWVIGNKVTAIVQKEQKAISTYLLNEDGTQISEREVLRSDKEIRNIKSVYAHNKIALLWKKVNRGGKSFLTILNEDGTLARESEFLFGKEGFNINPTQIIAYGNGFKVAWQEPVGKYFRIMLFDLDKEGKKRGMPKEVYTSSHATSTNYAHYETLNLVENDGDLILSWVEQEEGGEYTGGNYVDPGTTHHKSTVKILKLDLEGNPRGEVNALSHPVDDRDLTDPLIVPFDGHLALFWSEGSYIYECRGCYPDYRVSLILLDSKTLSPLSEVLKIGTEERVNPDDKFGGLRDKQVVIEGTQFHIVSKVQYHVHTESAYGRIECK